MQFVPTIFADAWLIELEPFRDQRGFFARTFCMQEFATHGLETSFPQHSVSFSTRIGTLRGMHFQREPHGEVKVVRCINGIIWDVIVDIRRNSPTFRRWQGFELSSTNRRQLYIPKGFAHGFQALSDDVEVGYLISEPYSPAFASGIRHDDPGLAIAWPMPVTMVSEKDTRWPVLESQQFESEIV